MDSEIKHIGDYLGTIEEFVPGEGTYADEGKIYASTIGKMVLDTDKHLVKINGKFPLEPRVGQVVYGDVLSIRKNMVTIIIRKIQNAECDVDIKCGLYISNIADTYIEKPDDAFGIGDIVKGEIIKIEGSLVDISTKGEFGAVKAFCKRCRHQLVKSDKSDMLDCKNCGSRENRKIAIDYGDVRDF